jgi:hypothetical protein
LQYSTCLKAHCVVGTSGDAANHGGVKCYLLQTEREDRLHGKVTERWWVSPERGWLVLKHERIASGNGGESVGGKLTRSIEDCAQVDGVWMPTVLTVKGEQTQPDGSSLWVMKEKLTLAYRGVNKPVPAATFRPEFPTGTKVIGPDGARVVGQ